ncbi:MAG: hypothetical protein IT494_01950 [Gammaproteobacteria bacterium]|nr:hypothetical protein [Gammaproteobacteria bacterium]
MNHAAIRAAAVGLFAALLCLTGCQGTTVRTSRVDPIVRDRTPLPEAELLDVGVLLFDPGTDGLDEDEAPEASKQIRRAESRYMPVLLADTLQKSGNWGVVRVVPSEQTITDLYVSATIRRSDGLHLELEAEAFDISGRQWLRRKYEETASKFNYDRDLNHGNDPFQGLYNRIANDLHAALLGLTSAEREWLRALARVRFARIFSPEQFNDYLTTGTDGLLGLQRLPADEDPMLRRIQKVRERDYLFTDLLQDYYQLFHRQMRGVYDEWRKDSYREIDALRLEKAQANAQIVGGAVALLGGIAAGVAGGDGFATQGAAIGAAAVGAPMIRAGLQRKVNVAARTANLGEMADSLNAEIEPHYIDLEDRTFRLTGTLDEQYAQWRQILMAAYREETQLETPAAD